MRQMIPNAFTSANLVFGMCSLMATFSGLYAWAAGFIFLALVADGMDGRVARALGVSSEMGKEMDSLCDLGSFGIAPAMLAYQFGLHEYGVCGVAAAIFFALCAMWRLARFNVNTSVVHGYFMGLASPAGACCVASTTFLMLALGETPATLGVPYLIFFVIVAYLMVSHVHYPDFKGDGEPIYLVPKILTALLFFAALYLGFTAGTPIGAISSAIFLSNALLGIANSFWANFIAQKA